jgi:hypothetical protein
MMSCVVVSLMHGLSDYLRALSNGKALLARLVQPRAGQMWARNRGRDNDDAQMRQD